MMHIASMPRRQERGFALVAAIFIVVVLAMLGIMMVTIGGMERATASAAVQGTRAFYAARSGIEWGVFRAMPPTNSCVASTTFTLTAPGLEGFNVIVQCALTPPGTQHREGAPPNINVYVITSIARLGNFGEADYVSRTLQVTATDAP